MNIKAKKILTFTISFIIVIVSLIFIQKLFMPKYAHDVLEGTLIAEYYDDVKDHDVIFIGDCEVYENFTPQVLWDNYGINSFIRGSAQQLIWQSYYLLEDTLRYEKPKVVVFNVLSMKYDKPQNEAYNRMSIDGMKWSMSKVNNIKASMCENESFIEYVFPLLRYHSRWDSLSKDDIEYLMNMPKNSFNGYYMRIDEKPALNVPEGDILADYTFGDNSYYYLDKITKLCKDNDIKLILIKAPSLYPYWYDQWEEQMVNYAKDNDLVYINYLDLIDEVGLDFNHDTYDAGLHLNLSGATKLTNYFGQYLKDELNLKDRHGEESLDNSWKLKKTEYNEEIDRQRIKYGL